MTISNLGARTLSRSPHQPARIAVLAVGKVMPQVCRSTEDRDQERVSLTLSVDHRVVSGKYAADFLGRSFRSLKDCRVVQRESDN